MTVIIFSLNTTVKVINDKYNDSGRLEKTVILSFAQSRFEDL